jgi:hypothetical protein
MDFLRLDLSKEASSKLRAISEIATGGSVSDVRLRLAAMRQEE